jgi:methionyl-tRNA formyltransferase
MMEPVTFYLMNRKGWSVLKAVLDKFGSPAVHAVIASRDAAMAKDYYDEITGLCREHNVSVYDRNSTGLKPSAYKIAIGWRWIIPDAENLIVLHDALLPRYRGFAPLVNSLINGEKKAGVTALFASAEYDKGDVISQLETTLSYPVKIADAIEQVSNLYEQLVLDILNKLAAGKKLSANRQDERNASYSLWRDEDDYRIDWMEKASVIRRFIDAVGFPFKGASAVVDGKMLRISDAEELPDVKIENRQTGKVIFVYDGKPVVVCGEGLLKINALHDEAGNSMLPFSKFRSRFA